MIEYKIITYKEEDCIFAEIQTTTGETLCIADGNNEYNAIKEVCLVFSDILEDYVKNK